MKEKIDKIANDKSIEDKDKSIMITLLLPCIPMRPTTVFPPVSIEEKVDLQFHLLSIKYPKLFGGHKIKKLSTRQETLLEELFNDWLG